MVEKWRVVINGEIYIEVTTRCNWAIRKALQKYKDKHSRAYSMSSGLTIFVTRENQKQFPISKIV